MLVNVRVQSVRIVIISVTCRCQAARTHGLISFLSDCVLPLFFVTSVLLAAAENHLQTCLPPTRQLLYQGANSVSFKTRHWNTTIKSWLMGSRRCDNNAASLVRLQRRRRKPLANRRNKKTSQHSTSSSTSFSCFISSRIVKRDYLV